MKCPEKEQLMLYVEGELTSKELAEVKTHLLTCKECQNEVQQYKYDLETELLLRNQVNAAFNKRTVNQKIMNAIMNEPKPVVATKSNKIPFWLNFVLKFMVPALAIAIALLVFFCGSSSQTPMEYKGSLYRVSVMASQEQNPCFVDNQTYLATCPFDINSDGFKQLNGSFIINVSTPNDLYSLKLEGQTKLSFDPASMTLILNDCKANVSIISGNSVKVKINDEQVVISIKKPYKSLLESYNNASETVDLNKKKVIKITKPVVQIATLSVNIATATDIIEEKNNISNESEEKNENIDNNNNQSLTQEPSSGISIIESLSGKGYSDSESPFDEREIDAD